MKRERTAKVLDNIADGYRKSARYEKARQLYKRAVEMWPEAEYAMESNKGYVLCSIAAGDDPNAQSGVEKLVSDFNNNVGLPDCLFEIAQQYEHTKRYRSARSVYEQIVADFPGSSKVGAAQLHLRKLDVYELMWADEREASGAIENLIADFKDHPHWVDAMIAIGVKYYEESLRLRAEGEVKQSKAHLRQALWAFERVKNELGSAKEMAAVRFWAALCYRHMSDYERSLELCRSVVDCYPGSAFAGPALALLSQNCVSAKRAGLITQEEGNLEAEWACRRILDAWADSEWAAQASLTLGNLLFEREQWEDAAAHFELYLERHGRGLREVLYPLGVAYKNIGELGVARDLYRQFIVMGSPSDPRIKRAEAWLKDTMEHENEGGQ